MTQTEVDDMTQWICKTFPLTHRGATAMNAMADVERLLAGLPVPMAEDRLAERAASKGKWNTTARGICQELRILNDRLTEQRQERDTPYPMWPLSLPWPEGTIIIRDEDYEQARVIRHVKARVRERDATAHALEGPSRLLGEVRWRPRWSFKRVYHRSYCMDLDDRQRMTSLDNAGVLRVRALWRDWDENGTLVHEVTEKNKNKDWAWEVVRLIQGCP